MKLFKAIALSAFFAALAGAAIVNTHSVRADSASSTGATSTAAIASGSCSPTAAGLAQIKAIQNDPTLSYTAELQQELALRKQLLAQTIGCAQAEAQDLQSSLANVQATGGVANLQSELSSRLNDAIDFYNIESAKINGVGISGSQAIAREVLAYRAGSYAPLSGQVNNFILWSGNQNLFATAQTRFNETSRAVSFLESATPDPDLQNTLNAARASLSDAQSENQAAENALIQLLPPEQSLMLIQSSLSSLSDTYQRFFDVSNLIQTLLPQ